MKLIVISGRSGSGKSTALKVLEDIGYFCVDNIPVGLLPELAKHAMKRLTEKPDEPRHVAVGIDARNTISDLLSFPVLLKEIPKEINVDIIFVDANDDILIKRFSETRRKHPLTNDEVSLPEALAIESKQLAAIAAMADLSIDSSFLNIHQLRSTVRERVGTKNNVNLSVLIQSFGYKGSIPIDSDFVFDVRCLPNPYWNTELREYSGRDPVIQQFLGANEDVKKMIEDIKHFLDQWLPKFQEDNRSYLTVSIGCTGGKHRSVFIAEQLYQYLSPKYEDIKVRHRELINAEN